MTRKVDIEEQKEDRLVFGGLLGVNTLVVLEIMNTSSLDTELRISLLLSSIALPLLALRIMTLTVEERNAFTIDPAYIRLPKLIAPILSFGSMAMVFWHFGWLYGASFVVISILSVAAFLRFFHAYQSVNEEVAKS